MQIGMKKTRQYNLTTVTKCKHILAKAQTIYPLQAMLSKLWNMTPWRGATKYYKGKPVCTTRKCSSKITLLQPVILKSYVKHLIIVKFYYKI